MLLSQISVGGRKAASTSFGGSRRTSGFSLLPLPAELWNNTVCGTVTVCYIGVNSSSCRFGTSYEFVRGKYDLNCSLLLLLFLLLLISFPTFMQRYSFSYMASQKALEEQWHQDSHWWFPLPLSPLSFSGWIWCVLLRWLQNLGFLRREKGIGSRKKGQLGLSHHSLAN